MIFNAYKSMYVDIFLILCYNNFRPGGIQNFRYVVLQKKHDQNDNSGYGLFSVLLRICIATLALLSTMIFIKRIRLYWTGRHKKYDARFY